MSNQGSAGGHPGGRDDRGGAVPNADRHDPVPGRPRGHLPAPRIGAGPIIYTVCILVGVNTMNFFDRQILPAVQETIRAERPLSDSEPGWLGTAFILLYAVVGLPLGRLADVGRRRWILAVGVGLWSALTIGSGLAWGFWSLFVMRLGVGVGEAS